MRRIALVAALACGVAAVTIFRPPPAAGPFARDFEAYVAAGAIWDGGGNPWSRDVWPFERVQPGVDEQRDELLPFVGPAAELPLLGAFARMPHDVAVAAWTALLIAALIALLSATLALAQARGPAIVAAAVVALFAPLTSDIALGQAAVIAAAGIALALLACERRAVAPAALASLVAAIQPNLALALIARARDRSAVLAFGLALGAFAVLTVAASGGVQGAGAYFQRLVAHGHAEGLAAIQFTVAAIAWACGASEGVARGAGAAVALAALAALIVATRRARLDALDGTLLAVAALPFIVPFFHEHDFVVELIPLLTVGLRAQGTARMWAGIAAGALAVDWLALGQRVPAQPFLLLQGLTIAGAFIALGRGRLRRADYAAPLTILIAACIAVPLARAHPVPVWPDALPATFHAAPDEDASAVWGDEQRVAGLLAQVPAWGALRAIPLAGCVALGISVVASRRRRVVPLRYRRS